MEKVILVQPCSGSSETTYAPLGLMSLAAFVRRDFPVELVDLRFTSEEDICRMVARVSPLVVAFSVLTGGCIHQVLRLSAAIKKINPKVKIILGGIHPTFFPEQSLQEEHIDFVVVGEGEQPFLELLWAIKGNRDMAQIKNIGYKNIDGYIIINPTRDEFLDINQLPMPAWDLIDVDRYVEKLSRRKDERVINMYTSKGCPFACSFCYNLNFNKRKWRGKAPQLAVEEIKFLHQKYKIDYFIIHDDNFVVDKNRALQISELIIKNNLKIRYSIDIRIDRFDEDFLMRLKESGLVELRVGAESGSNRILKDIVQKGLTAEQIVRGVETAKKLGLRLLLSFVVGWPTETIVERQATINFILKLQKIYPKTEIYPLWIYIPYPGTPLFERAKEFGFKAPKSFAKWGDYSWGKAHIPWLHNRKEYEMIHQLSPLVWYNKTLFSLPKKSFKNIFRHLFKKLLRPFMLFRFKNNSWRFPLDVKMLMFLKNFKGIKPS